MFSLLEIESYEKSAWRRIAPFCPRRGIALAKRRSEPCVQQAFRRHFRLRHPSRLLSQLHEPLLQVTVQQRNRRLAVHFFSASLAPQQLFDRVLQLSSRQQRFDQLAERHRRNASALCQPLAGEHRTQHVEVLLQPYPLALQVIAEVAFPKMEVVMDRASWRIQVRRHLAHAADNRAPFEIADRRMQPLQQRRVGLREQLKRFADVPPAEVQLRRDRPLDDVASRMHAQVPLRRMRVQEAHVVIAVLRRKAPGAAA